MRRVWYYLNNVLVRIVLFFTFRQRSVFNIKNIPRGAGIIFIPNHQNALVDAIQIPTLPPRPYIHFITRSDVFKNPLVGRFLRSLNMIPIYRLRDGRDKLAKNEAILDYCAEILSNGGMIQIFAEGNHHHERRVRPLKPGFAEIAFRAIEKSPSRPVMIVPVGLNYDAPQQWPASVSLYYGTPVDARQFFDPSDRKKSAIRLAKAVFDELKKYTTHIEAKGEEYQKQVERLEAAGIDYLNPDIANEFLQTGQLPATQSAPKPHPLYARVIKKLFLWNSFLPLRVWRKLRSRIRDKVFYNTFRFAMILTVFPMYYLLVALVIGYFFGWKSGVLYFGASVLLGYLRKSLPLDAGREN